MSLDASARIAPLTAQYRSDCHRETAAALLHGFTLSVGFGKVGAIGKVAVLSPSNDGGEFLHNLPPVGSGAGGDGVLRHPGNAPAVFHKTCPCF
jgi:hypothetical protein